MPIYNTGSSRSDRIPTEQTTIGNTENRIDNNLTNSRNSNVMNTLACSLALL